MCWVTPKEKGVAVNCGNCKNWKNDSCSVRYILDELYAETKRFKVFDHMMRTNKGIQGPM
jgi:hypothetical protein